ncbi:uncharacterized protein RCC_07091 [Ramularia collo-cygni]|uniref:Uncharacterized protein n=1 Tax=Ramularia collo-cygni TaxID=112498 RepID=A0A2D3VH31_9PEZI|nr:uncharacterized protein RCC_07091 [Ramularia collo-cygni]CZT21229.1 uncharacterized protein RCC_07091 [Ramularia collo-cygni]
MSITKPSPTQQPRDTLPSSSRASASSQQTDMELPSYTTTTTSQAHPPPPSYDNNPRAPTTSLFPGYRVDKQGPEPAELEEGQGGGGGRDRAPHAAFEPARVAARAARAQVAAATARASAAAAAAAAAGNAQGSGLVAAARDQRPPLTAAELRRARWNLTYIIMSVVMLIIMISLTVMASRWGTGDVVDGSDGNNGVYENTSSAEKTNEEITGFTQIMNGGWWWCV